MLADVCECSRQKAWRAARCGLLFHRRRRVTDDSVSFCALSSSQFAERRESVIDSLRFGQATNRFSLVSTKDVQRRLIDRARGHNGLRENAIIVTIVND